MENQEYLQLIWDFKGPDALLTAQHHVIHLKDFIKANNLLDIACDVQQLNNMHSIAFMVVSKSDMPAVRDRLKPHRGKIWTT